MKNIDSVVNQVATEEKSKRQFAEKLREKGEQLSLKNTESLESRLIKKTDSSPSESFSICGVDGGSVKKEFHGINILLSRAVGSVFTYEKGKLTDSNFVPQKMPSPEVEVINQDLRLSTSIIRWKKEIEVALSSIQEQPDAIFLDGSIVPHPNSIPKSGNDRYDNLIDKVNKLHNKARENDIILAGIIEDSRGTRFRDVLQEAEALSDIPDNIRDSVLFDYLLEKNERSFTCKYSSSKNNPALRELDQGDKVYSFYLKTVKNGRPLRIDFSGSEDLERVKKISELVKKTAQYNSSYGIPSVIIEADQRAKIKQEEIKAVKDRILAKTGPISSLKELRREERPF